MAAIGGSKTVGCAGRISGASGMPGSRASVLRAVVGGCAGRPGRGGAVREVERHRSAQLPQEQQGEEEAGPGTFLHAELKPMRRYGG
jgi:hypothetical protein